MSKAVTLFEMGPRDGLQNEKTIIATQDKICLVDLLSDCGFQKIEVTSFVSPRWVPQMADASEVLGGIQRFENTYYTALTPNIKGFEAALKAGINEIALFASASEGFSRRNINCTIEESLERFKPVLQKAKESDIPVRAYISCVVQCPYDGAVDPGAVASLAGRLIDMGCYEISLGDTIGAGTPETIDAMLDAVLSEVTVSQLAGHYHDTNGKALENIQLSLDKGLRVFDSAIAGLGGCPYAPGAKGNVDTHAVVTLLHKLGFETGIDIEKLKIAERYALSLKQV